MEPAKIRIDLRTASYRDELPDEVAGETLWAEPQSEDRFRLRNSPAYARGLAHGDVVECERNPATGWCEFVRLVEDSGNGNLRIYFVDGDAREAKAIVAELGAAGCEYERGSERLFMFVVPPSVRRSLADLSNLLNEAQVVEAWEFGKEPRFRAPGSTH